MLEVQSSARKALAAQTQPKPRIQPIPIRAWQAVAPSASSSASSTSGSAFGPAMARCDSASSSSNASHGSSVCDAPVATCGVISSTCCSAGCIDEADPELALCHLQSAIVNPMMHIASTVRLVNGLAKQLIASETQPAMNADAVNSFKPITPARLQMTSRLLQAPVASMFQHLVMAK